MTEQFDTPVLFIIFNRPEYTRRVFEAIRAARPKKLFISADGPRSASEEAVCQEVRAIAEQVDWPCEIEKKYSNKNLGLKYGPSSGISWFFEHVEEGIILEDDCLPHPDFFRFASEMLSRYREDARIFMISGDKFLSDFEIPCSYFFSKYFPIWGWATWRRAWNLYDISIEQWGLPESRARLEKLYREEFMVDHLSKIFNDVYSGRLLTWDVQWLYTCVMNEGLCILPSENLVSNIGVVGIHTPGEALNLSTRDLYIKKELRHPLIIEQNKAYDAAFYEKGFKPRPKSIKARAISVLIKYKTIKQIYRFMKRVGHATISAHGTTHH